MIHISYTQAEVSVLMVQRSWRTQDYLNILRGLAPELDTLPPRPGPLKLKRLPYLRHIVAFTGPPEKYVQKCMNTVLYSRYIYSVLKMYWIWTLRSGMHLFEDLAETASGEQLRAVRDLQREVQIDDPMQMMFTSGSFILNSNSFALAVIWLISKNLINEISIKAWIFP